MRGEAAPPPQDCLILPKRKQERKAETFYKRADAVIVWWTGSELRCEHKCQRSRCKACGGSSICEHNRQKQQCRDCGGSGICEHKRHRSICRDCKGSGICEHGKRRTRCRDCSGDPICIHGKVAIGCVQCGGEEGAELETYQEVEDPLQGAATAAAVASAAAAASAAVNAAGIAAAAHTASNNVALTTSLNVPSNNPTNNFQLPVGTTSSSLVASLMANMSSLPNASNVITSVHLNSLNAVPVPRASAVPVNAVPTNAVPVHVVQVPHAPLNPATLPTLIQHAPTVTHAVPVASDRSGLR
jgi:hypothetical protein